MPSDPAGRWLVDAISYVRPEYGSAFYEAVCPWRGCYLGFTHNAKAKARDLLMHHLINAHDCGDPNG